MNKNVFYYKLPPELIAQAPAERRDMSRLLCLDRMTGAVTHKKFFELTEFLRAGDCLVLNDTRVLPARLYGARETGGAVEVVLLRDTGGGVWECLTRPGRKTREGTRLVFGGGELTATVTGEARDGNKLLTFYYDGIFLEVLERLGQMPLPPYIHAQLADSERYQTVYSKNIGSAAAPTAGLHFTDELIESIRARGVSVCFITLHVGLGTFRPVKAETLEEHKMHAEHCVIPSEAACIVNDTKARGGRVIAVGTTTCRTLEAFADETGLVTESSGFTDIFIYPGYEFKCIDGLITNFHLPESTLIMLVSAFAGRENVMRAYEEAVRLRYRFFSFGDCCLIL